MLTITLSVLFLIIFMMLRSIIRLKRRKKEFGKCVSSYSLKTSSLFSMAFYMIFPAYFFGDNLLELCSHYHEIEKSLFVLKAANYISVIGISLIVAVQCLKKTEVYEKGLMIELKFYSYSSLEGYYIVFSSHENDRLFLQKYAEKGVKISPPIRTQDIHVFENDIKQFIPRLIV